MSGAALLTITIGGAGGLLAAPTAAEPGSAVAQAVASARGSGQCRPLRYDQRVEHAAEIINRSTRDYVNHTAHSVPIDDPHPTAIVKDLGIEGSRSLSMQGAGYNETDAIKGVLLEGYTAIPDCSYTQFGAGRLFEEQSGFVLLTVVLVGP